MNIADFLYTLWVVSGFISGGYLLFLLFTVFFTKNTVTSATQPEEGISIIIAAHNELENLKAFLPIILQQDYPVFEVIVACDRCADGSLEYLRSLRASSLRIIAISDINPSVNPKKQALTLAIQQATHSWILLTDADCYPAGNQWIRCMVQAKGSRQVCLGLSFYTGKPSLLHSFIRMETLFTAMQYAAWALIGKPYMAVGRNLLYAKQLFINNSGYGKHSAHMGGDDDLLIQSISNAQNTAVCLNHHAFTYTPSPKGFQAWWKQKHRHINAGKQYPLAVLTGLSLYPLSSILFYGLAPYYIISSEFPIAIALYVLRTCIFIITFACIGWKWKYAVFLLFLPVLELIYLLYLIVASFYSLVIPIKKWK